MTFTLATATADTCVHTHSASHTSYITITAAYDYALAGRKQFNHTARAGIDTTAAGSALFLINDSQIVHHLNCTEGTVIHTVAHADAGKAAVLGTACHGSGSGTADIAIINIAFFGNTLGTLAAYAGNQALFFVTGFSAHDGSDLASRFRAAGRAAVDRRFTGDYCSSIAIAPRIATGTAVGT